jgi:hypothetical protein
MAKNQCSMETAFRFVINCIGLHSKGWWTAPKGVVGEREAFCVFREPLIKNKLINFPLLENFGIQGIKK